MIGGGDDDFGGASLPPLTNGHDRGLAGAALVSKLLHDELEDREIDAVSARDREQPTPPTPTKAPTVKLYRLSDLAGAIIEQSKVPSFDWGFPSLTARAPLPMRAAATIVGPTGAGKTSLAMAIGAHHARFASTPGPSQGPTVHFLFELTPPQTAARRVAQIAPNGRWAAVLGGAYSQQELEAFLVGEHYFVIKVPRGVDFIDVARRALDEAQRLVPGVPLAIFDYLQRIKGASGDLRMSTTDNVDRIVDLTEERDMFTLLLSKGSRFGSRAMRDGKTRGEAHVDSAAETSAIEAGSAAMLAITYENRDGSEVTDVRLAIAKGRYGASGAEIGMQFHGPSGRWTELEALPVSKADREVLDRVLKAMAGTPQGFESRNELWKAVGGNKQAVMKVLARELEPGGALELRDGRIHRARQGAGC